MTESDIRDLPSRPGDAAARRTGTFSYLPPFGAEETRAQVDYLVRRDLEAAVEHAEPERAARRYWHLWKLPLFGVRDADLILGEVRACAEANPGHHVRLVGYDTRRQTQVVAFLVTGA